MQRLTVTCTVACLLALAAPVFSQATPPAGQAAQKVVPSLDDRVATAIKAGVEYLYSLQKADGSWETFGFIVKIKCSACDKEIALSSEFVGKSDVECPECHARINVPKAKPMSAHPGSTLTGPTALAVYALLEAGENPQNPKIIKALDFMARHSREEEGTYALGLRCCAWQIANKTTAGKYRRQLEADAERLVKSTADGSYSYRSKGDGESTGDNSNSQYGLLGVWMAGRDGFEVPQEYWAKVMLHWMGCQNYDGGWGYVKGSSSAGAMTAAGIASVFVCHDNLVSGAFIKCQGGREYQPLKRGLDWMDRNFQNLMEGKGPFGYSDWFYFLYGVERVGLASGYKYFGKYDWYKLGAEKLLSYGQGKWAGSWGHVEGTAYAMLFLVRGRNAVVFNKLQFASAGTGKEDVLNDWNCRPRDLANFTAWASKTFEKTVNWQIINLKSPVEEWHDAPIVYIAGSRAPKFSDADIAKLRTYVLQGGTIFSVTQCSGRAFNTGIRQAYAKMFPEYQMAKLPPTHDIYKVYWNLSDPKLKRRESIDFFEISNGVRPLVIHTDVDLPNAWQLNRTGIALSMFYAGANVYHYVTDRGKGLRSRASHSWPAEFTGASKGTIKIVRVKWSSPAKTGWNPEPLALERFGRLFARQTGYKVEVLKPCTADEVAPSGAQLAILSGIGRIALPGSQSDALKKFVDGGGTLLVDAAGGDDAFFRSATTLVRDIFGAGELNSLAPSAAVYNVASVEDGVIDTVKYRRKTNARLTDQKEPLLKAVVANGGDRAAVFFSREDLSNAGLVGYQCFTVDGYDPGDIDLKGSSYRLMRNIVLYAAGKDRAAKQGAK